MLTYKENIEILNYEIEKSKITYEDKLRKLKEENKNNIKKFEEYLKILEKR